MHNDTRVESRRVHVCRKSEHLLGDIGGDGSHSKRAENTHLVPEQGPDNYHLYLAPCILSSRLITLYCCLIIIGWSETALLE